MIMKKEIKNIVFGYGPLEDLLRLPSVSEIMVVDREHVYIERNGVLENSGKRFISDEIIETIIQRNVRLGEAPSYGESIIKYDASSKGAANYLNMAHELLQKNTQTV